MLGGVEAGTGGLRGGQVKTWTGVSNDDHESRWIDFDAAANGLGAVILAAVEYRVGQRFLESDENVDLFAFAGAIFLDKVHYRLARIHHGFRVPREGELPGDGLLFHGLTTVRQAAPPQLRAHGPLRTCR